jgi:ribosome biogenesis GTPase
MPRLTKRQKEQIHYYLRHRTGLKDKARLIHDSRAPKFIEKHLPYVRKVAKNLDQILIVGSFVSPEIKTGLIDRLLVLAEIEGISPVICLNKSDLLPEGAQDWQIAEMYAGIGYPTVLTSAKKAIGLSELYESLKGKRSALSGHSGVGKSSLLNALSPHLQIHVEEVSRSHNKGRHATTQVRIYKLDEQTEVIDLPGLKMIDFIDIHPFEARLYFREFHQFADDCHFSDCLHLTEERCAVKEAVTSGHIHPLRYQSYINFVESLR